MELVANAETRLIPALSVSGTYDSNVFYTPKSLLGPDLKPEDYYTRITPQLIVAHRGEAVSGSASVGALITRYLYNPSLDYTGINAATTLDLSRLASRLSPRIEGLSFNGAYQYTPNISGFGAYGGGAIGGSYGGTGFVGPLDAGLITNRVTMQTYNATISGGYRLTPVTSMTGSYSHTRISFGSQSGDLANQLFDTVGHAGSAGIMTRLSALDTLGTTATLSHFSQEGASSSPGVAGSSNSFTTITGIGNWGRRWTREIGTSLGGGAILTLPIDSEIPGQQIKSQVTPTVTGSLTYSSYSETLRDAGTALSTLGPFEGLPVQSGSLMPGGILGSGRYTAALSYTLGVYPSYAIGAGPFKAHIVGANLSGGLTSSLSGSVGVNYSHGSSNNPRFSYDTVGLTTQLNYLIGSSLVASLQYQYLYFANSLNTTTGAAENIAFSKKMITLTLAYAFNSQSFFRAGGFSSFGVNKAGTVGSGEMPTSGAAEPKKQN